MTENPLVTQLAELGLGAYEAPVYLALLENSPTSAGFLAKKLKFSRSTVYAALDRLSAKGLAGTTYRNNVKQFIGESPSVIADLLKAEQNSLTKRQALFSKISDQLKFLERGDTQVPSIVFFEGQDSLKKIYLDMLRNAPNKATMYIMRSEFVWQSDWNFIFSADWKELVKRLRSEKNIKTELLINDSAIEKKQASYYKTRKHVRYKFLPKTAKLKDFSLYILGDTVSLLSFEKNNLVGVKITNKTIADNFKQTFQALWTR